MKRIAAVLTGAVVAVGFAIAFAFPQVAPVATRLNAKPTPASSPGIQAGSVLADQQAPSPAPNPSPAPAAAGRTPMPPKIATSPAINATPRPQPAAAPVPYPVVTLTLATPSGTSSYGINAATVTDACNVLTAAKDQGFIRSVTLDYSYLKTFHSAYVREINGYENNWTVKVNGSSPKGCSLASVNKGDTVSWTYQ